MATLHLDRLTAAVALASLGAHGGDLSTLGQAVDEDWKRFAPDPKTGSRHLISTMGNRQECPPTGLPYYNAQFIRPGRIDAEHRPMSERFLRGSPLMCAEVTRDGGDYRLTTALLKMGMGSWMTLDWERGSATFHVQHDTLPEVTLAAMAGRRLGDVVATGSADDLVITDARIADAREMGKVANRTVGPGMAIDTTLPQWTEAAFTAIYTR